MRQTFAKTQLFLMCFAAVAFCARRCPGRQNIEIEASAKTVGKYEKLELLIRVDEHYNNPFDPDLVDLSVLIKTPGGKRITLPAFFSQDYERRKLSQGRSRANWYYPLGLGTWKARFAPTETGAYSATAKLKDQDGIVQS